MLNKRTLPFIFGLLFAGGLFGQNSTVSGEFTAEPPTLVSLGFEWRITGRRQPQRQGRESATARRANRRWRPALPLMRLQREQIGIAPGSERRQRSGALSAVPLHRRQHVLGQHSEPRS